MDNMYSSINFYGDSHYEELIPNEVAILLELLNAIEELTPSISDTAILEIFDKADC